MSSSTVPSPVPSPATPKRKRRTKLWLILGGCLLVAVGGIAAYVVQGKREKPTSVTTEKAIVKTITQLVSATGKVQPEVEVKITPEVTGEVTELPYREGAPVKKGDLLLRIKPDNYRFQVEQQEAALVGTKAASLDAKARLLKAEEDYRRSKDLADKHLISESELIAVKTALESAQASYDSALANIRRAEGSLSQARDLLTKTVIYSPIDGTISSRSTEVGERVAGTGQYGGAEVMRVADLTSMEVRVNINENDIVNVKVGDKAKIAIDAYPGRKFEAMVKEIGSAAKITGQFTQDEVTNFQVKIRILDKDVALRPGMSANADVETKTAENVVAVPIQSVTVRSREGNKTIDDLASARDKKAGEMKGEGAASAVNEKAQRQREKSDRESLNRVVFLRDGNKVKMVSVETGIADTTHIEIKSGLKAGDEVVSGSFSVITRTLKDGMQVKIDKPKTEEKK
ncbi:MAG: efflux RND transporter periplasmic adaptor subunit [Opitutae bacterium]|nr:efflux RND transporter periplasmic adaptor subunit [Opitutae bacterium]